MADETMAGKNIANIYAGGDPSVAAAVYAGEAGIKPGFAIRVVNGVAYLAQLSDGYWSGVAALKIDQDIDTAYSASEFFEYYPAGQDTMVWMYAASTSPAVTLTEQAGIMILSATDGCVKVFAYTGAAADHLTKVGRFRGASVTTSTSYLKVIKVWLGSGA